MQITEAARDILQEIINTGIGKAAVSFSEILDREIKLFFPTLRIFEFDELNQFLQSKGQNEYVAVRQSFTGGLEGTGFVSFPLQDGKTLVQQLLESDSPEAEFGILERETITEVGNVLINAVACTISDMIEVETHYELPELDLNKQNLSFKNDHSHKIYCLGEGNFVVEGIAIQGMMIFILTYNKIEQVLAKLSY